MMHGDEKSDPAIVAIRTNADGIHREKPANEGGQPPEELAEPRACPKRRLGVGAKGNAIEHGMRRTPGRENMSHGLDRVRQAARQKDERFTALLHHVDVELLGSAYGWLRKEASAGVDGVTWAAYGEGLEPKLTDLHDRIHRGTSSGYSNGYAVGTLASLAYRAQPSRRVYIPKPDGRERPLGIAALEDKIVQRALVEVLNAIWEEDFLGFSYGFRPGRGQHDALDALATGIDRRKVNWILDADIAGFPRVKPKGML
jgi:RNA-directed DNA polymerase